MPNADDPDPPPKKYTLKARPFEAVNPPAGPAPEAGRIDVNDLYKVASAPHAFGHPSTPAPRAAPVPAANDVRALMRDNVAHEVPKELPPPVRETRRRTDYWICLIGGNALIAGLVYAIGLNLGTLIFGGAGIIMFSLTLTWVMWFVMDRY